MLLSVDLSFGKGMFHTFNVLAKQLNELPLRYDKVAVCRSFRESQPTLLTQNMNGGRCMHVAKLADQEFTYGLNIEACAAKAARGLPRKQSALVANPGSWNAMGCGQTNHKVRHRSVFRHAVVACT